MALRIKPSSNCTLLELKLMYYHFIPTVLNSSNCTLLELKLTTDNRISGEHVFKLYLAGIETIKRQSVPFPYWRVQIVPCWN